MTTGAAPRRAAARTLAAVLDRHRNLATALAPELGGLEDSRDRALARRLTLAVLRDLPALEFRLGRLLEKPLPRRARNVRLLLLSALAELFEAREPARAVVHASVAAARLDGHEHLAGLVNAVLRNYRRQAAQIEAALPDDPQHRHGHPEWLVEALQRDWPDDWQSMLAANNRPPPVWLRVNRRRITRAEFLEQLAAAGHPASADDVLPEAIRLDKAAAITGLPGYRRGWFAVQDAGAQWAAAWMQLQDGLRVLDACAAPGGKTAHMLEHAAVELSAVELDPKRLEATRAGLERLGLAGEMAGEMDSRLIAADATRPAAWWDGRPFDRILIDAPCSATGVIRRHPDIRWLRRPEDIVANAEVQRRLLDALWPLLKPGGMLVYATCSVLAEENDRQINAFVERTPDARDHPLPEAPGRRMEIGRQIMPGEAGMDGFYYCRLVRLQSGT